MKFFQWGKVSDSEVSHNASIKKKVLLEAQDIPNILQLAQAIFPAGEIAKGHIHDDLTEVFMVIEGGGEIQVNNETLALVAGDTIVIEAGDYHELRNTTSKPLIVNYFSVSTV